MSQVRCQSCKTVHIDRPYILRYVQRRGSYYRAIVDAPECPAIRGSSVCKSFSTAKDKS